MKISTFFLNTSLVKPPGREANFTPQKRCSDLTTSTGSSPLRIGFSEHCPPRQRSKARDDGGISYQSLAITGMPLDLYWTCVSAWEVLGSFSQIQKWSTNLSMR